MSIKDRRDYILEGGIMTDMAFQIEKYRVKPFKIMDNLYFVGNKQVGMHLFETEEGLLLLDSGWPWSRELLLQSIWELGFRPDQIKLIVHTHGHIDHIGATPLLKELSGAKTCMSRADATMMRERPELTYADERMLFVPDIEIDDNDIIRLGSTEILAKAAPGHTIGTMAFFCMLKDADGMEYRAGMHGGLGTNTLTREYLDTYGLPDMRRIYLESLERLMGERVDITLGNHTEQNRTEEKRAEMLRNPGGSNPFIDKKEWVELLALWKNNLLSMCKQEEKQEE